MGLEIIIFIAAILFGIFLYWRESNGNGLYRFVNKIVNSKELQMKPLNRKGFVFRQSFLPRLVFVAGFFLIIAIVLQFLTPFKIFGSYNGISAFSSIIVGTLIGTYIANFVLKSGNIIDEKTEDLENVVDNTIEKGKSVLDEAVEKGKDFIEDIKKKGETSAEKVEDKTENIKDDIKEDAKSARDRLKDKGLM